MMELETALVFPKTPRNGLRSAGVHAGGSTPSFEAETREPVSEPAFHKSGKLEDFEEIILPHLNAAYNLARWLLRNEQDAQDVVQEASLRAYRFFDGYKGGDAKAWLLTIVRNTSLTWRRRAKRDASNVLFDEVVHGAPADAPNAEERMVDADKTTALRNCIEALPTEYREVLILREFEEMSYKRIAETVGLPVGTVMSRLSRARQRLEACIGGRRAGAEK
jgi:RNA polymerase sigma-70 factor (ECF subfamily)